MCMRAYVDLINLEGSNEQQRVEIEFTLNLALHPLHTIVKTHV